jgi:hypothetical protein
MRSSATSRSRSLPELYGELAVASWETIMQRTMMMMTGTCTVDEYQSMIAEKVEAMQHATLALMTGGGELDMLAPFHAKARANAKRLRGEAELGPVEMT